MTSSAPESPPSRLTRWRASVAESALARIFFFIAAASAIGFGTVAIVNALGWPALPVNHPLAILGAVLTRLVPGLSGYFLLVHWIERRAVDELAWRRLVPSGLGGALLGAAVVAGVIGVLWLAGSYRVVSVDRDVAWARPLFVYAFATAVIEEVIFRGVLFRITEQKLGLWAALAISALLFGGVHLTNHGSTAWTSLAIAVEAGLLLGVIYQVTQSLHACIGCHMAWNFVAGPVLGSAVSGRATPSSWLQADFTGPAWLTGGTFGIEASLVTVLLSLAVTVTLLAGMKRVRRVPAAAIPPSTAT